MNIIMKFIHNIFESSRVHFEKGGKFEKLFPLFEATESFFFIPATPTRADAHIRDNLDVKRFMSFVILALIARSVIPTLVVRAMRAKIVSETSRSVDAEAAATVRAAQRPSLHAYRPHRSRPMAGIATSNR